jgi:hypothetical protein
MRYKIPHRHFTRPIFTSLRSVYFDCRCFCHGMHIAFLIGMNNSIKHTISEANYSSRNPPKNMDIATKVVGRNEKKGLAVSTYTWMVIILFVAMIPLFNFFLVPLLVFVGILGFGGYRLARTWKQNESNSKTKDTTLLQDEGILSDETHATLRPGLRSISSEFRTENKKGEFIHRTGEL